MSAWLTIILGVILGFILIIITIIINRKLSRKPNKREKNVQPELSGPPKNIGLPRPDKPRVESRPEKRVSASLAYPKLLSKRFSSTFLVHVYPKYLSRQATAAVKRQLVKLKKEPDSYNTTRQDTNIQINTLVAVKIECHGIKFTSPITVEVEDKVTELIFLAKPEDTCEVGHQMAKLSICDNKTGQEIFSLPFEIQVVDFVVDHISRPLILKLAAGISGLGGVVMYAMTLFEQVDKTTGLTSGTAFSVAAIAAYLLFNNLFQRLNSDPKTL